jgi:formate dehydrogenase accessory protein FdhD
LISIASPATSSPAQAADCAAKPPSTPSNPNSHQSNPTCASTPSFWQASHRRAAQETFNRTGGLHAAALFDADGKLIVLREDIGRHNAVDKVIGHSLFHGPFPPGRQILLVSGRSSFEIMQKALAARVPIVAAVSAPSTLAATFAKETGQTLIGFLRDRRMNIYANPQRITFPAPVGAP